MSYRVPVITLWKEAPEALPPALPPSLFWVKKEEMTEGRRAGRASKIEPGSLLY